MDATMSGAAELCLVIDNRATGRRLRQMIDSHFTSSELTIGDGDGEPALPPSAGLCVVAVDLGAHRSLAATRALLAQLKAQRRPSLFILDGFDRRSIVQLYALGGTEFVIRPIAPAQLRERIRSLLNNFVEATWADLAPVQQAALRSSLGIFHKLGRRTPPRAPLQLTEVSEACRLVVQATAGVDLQQWVSLLRQHHNYTYRHSMMVTAFLTCFARAVGFSGSDIEKLALGGLLHDIGKLSVPASILDKPGALEPEEWEVMRQHPAFGVRALGASRRGWDPDIIDCILHHHERLDGRGYPDGLAGNEVSDIVRLISIADVFSALVDKRAYKQPLDALQAFRILLDSEGQLERKLVEAFEPIALGLHKGDADQLRA
jgi:putative nucleotidyltransferase with HDIG domain